MRAARRRIHLGQRGVPPPLRRAHLGAGVVEVAELAPRDAVDVRAALRVLAQLRRRLSAEQIVDHLHVHFDVAHPHLEAAAVAVAAAEELLEGTVDDAALRLRLAAAAERVRFARARLAVAHQARGAARRHRRHERARRLVVHGRLPVVAVEHAVALELHRSVALARHPDPRRVGAHRRLARRVQRPQPHVHLDALALVDERS